MRKRYLLIPIIFSLLLVNLACSDYRPAKLPPWATDSNQFILGDDDGEPLPSTVSPKYALLVIEDVRCGASDEEGAYIVSVSWVATLENANSLKVEYEVVNEPVSGETLGMTQAEVAFELSESFESGSSEIEIAKEEIRDVGAVILVRMVVESASEGEYTSPVDDHTISQLCPKGE